MNLQFDFSRVTEAFQRIVNDLREKHLWPVAVALLAAMIAVPLFLLNSSSPASLATAPAVTPPPAQATSLPTLNVQTAPAPSRLTGRARDPFTQQVVPTSAATTTTTSTATATATATATHSTATAASSGSSTASTAPSSTASAGTPSSVSTTTAVTPRPITPPSAKPKPAPAGLTPTQSYRVSIAITNASGGLNTVNSLERLSILPNDKQPMLVELGVAKGGHDVLFAVMPGTLVSGPGKCTPGRTDCEILSLAQNQTEGLSTRTPAGIVPGPLFAVTSISVDNHPSAAAARKARTTVSAAGRALLSNSALRALPLFRYEPRVGAVVDLRNLTVSVG